MQRMATDPLCITLPSTSLGKDRVISKEARELTNDQQLLSLLSIAMDQGWTVKPTNNGKLMWYPKDKDLPPVTSPLKLMGRSYKNVMTSLQRSGLDTSSLRNDRAKDKDEELPDLEREAVVVRDKRDGLSDKEWEERRKKHEDFQQRVSDQLKEETMLLPGARDERTALVNYCIDAYLSEVGNTLMSFLKATAPAFTCDHHDLAEELEEATKLYMAADNELTGVKKELESMQSSLDRQIAKASRLGTELREALEAKTAAEERALKAENKLKVFRTALMDD